MRFVPGDRLLWWILAAALAVRLAAGAWWEWRLEPGQTFHFGDSETYWELAQAIAGGRPYRFRSPERQVFRTPGYPLLLAPVFLVAGEDAGTIWGRAITAVCGTVAVGGVYAFARHAFDQPTARIAAGVAAVYPGAVAMSGLVLTEAAFMAAIMWQLHGVGRLFCGEADSQFVTCTPRNRLPTPLALHATWVGVLGGVATLIRPSWLPFTPALVMLVVLFCRDRRNNLILAAFAVLGLVVAMTPWWVRNWQVTGHFVPTTLQVGASLYDGLNPSADGSSDMSHVDALAARHDLDEFELDRTLRQAAIDWARTHPGEAVRLAAVKFTRMWNVWPNEPAFRSWPARLIVAGSYLPVMLLAAIGAWRHRDKPGTLTLCLAPAAYFTVLHMIFVSSIRYRQPAMLPLIVLAAAAAVQRRLGPDHSSCHTNPKRERGRGDGVSSLALRVSVP